MAEGGKVRISVGFPDDIYEKLEEIAKKHHRTVASVVVEARSWDDVYPIER